MDTLRVLLVEDRESMRIILQLHIQIALAPQGVGPKPEVVASPDFPQGLTALRDGAWDLLVTDLGLPPRISSVFGMQLVKEAKERGIPCIVVSGTDDVKKWHIMQLSQNPDYGNPRMFDKDELESHPEQQSLFQTAIRQLAQRQSATRPESPPAGRRKITFAGGNPGLLLKSPGLPDEPIPEGLPTAVFFHFLLHVLDGKPGAVVTNADLNRAVGVKPADSADGGLRGVIHKLNDLVRSWARLAKDEACLVNAYAKGYRLNTSLIDWEVEPGLRFDAPAARSVRARAADPHIVQENTPSRDPSGD